MVYVGVYRNFAWKIVWDNMIYFHLIIGKKEALPESTMHLPCIL